MCWYLYVCRKPSFFLPKQANKESFCTYCSGISSTSKFSSFWRIVYFLSCKIKTVSARIYFPHFEIILHDVSTSVCLQNTHNGERRWIVFISQCICKLLCEITSVLKDLETAAAPFESKLHWLRIPSTNWYIIRTCMTKKI